MHRPVEILVVEDSPADARLLQHALRETKVPHRMHLVSNGQDAIDFLYRRETFEKASKPDLVLLDLNLPKKSGHDVLHDVKEDPELKAIPIIVLSSSGSAQDVQKAYNLHANCYLTKPTELDEFFELVRVLEVFWMEFARLPTAANCN
jgi:CheY-like chemotaxis protein